MGSVRYRPEVLFSCAPGLSDAVRVRYNAIPSEVNDSNVLLSKSKVA